MVLKKGESRSVLTDWAERHEPTAVARVIKRLGRFAGNTTDPATGLAAQELVDLIENSVPTKTPMGETDEE